MLITVRQITAPSPMMPVLMPTSTEPGELESKSDLLLVVESLAVSAVEPDAPCELSSVASGVASSVKTATPASTMSASHSSTWPGPTPLRSEAMTSRYRPPYEQLGSLYEFSLNSFQLMMPMASGEDAAAASS